MILYIKKLTRNSFFQTQVGRAADVAGHKQQRPDGLVHQHHGQQQPEQDGGGETGWPVPKASIFLPGTYGVGLYQLAWQLK